MAILRQLFQRRDSLGSPSQALIDAITGGGPTATGRNVDAESALRNTAVFACVRVLAESAASLPLILYRRRPDGGKERATDHPLYELLHNLPNPEMTSTEFRETMVGHLALRGNALAEKQIDAGGRVRALWPLNPDRVEMRRVEGRLVYTYRVPVTEQVVGLPVERVMHIRGLSRDGMWGYSPIRLAMEAVGLALATEEFGARFFGNGARPGAVYQHPGRLSKDAYDRLRTSFEMRHQGLENAHRVAILEEGMKITEIGVKPDEAQFLETRKFQVAEIARLFRVPPHMIGDLEKATFSNIEQQSLDFVTNTLRPWLVRWEQAIYRDLLTPAERKKYFAEHLVDGLLRGDIKSRYEAYSIARQNGWLSANDVRNLENQNPIDGGDVYLVPLNMVPANEIGGRSVSGETAGTDSKRSAERSEERARAMGVVHRQRIGQIYRKLIEEAARRVVNREISDVGRAARKYLGVRSAASDFEKWLTEFYAEHKAFFERQMLPVLQAYAEQLGLTVADEGFGVDDAALSASVREYVAELASQHGEISLLMLRNALTGAVEAGIGLNEAIGAELSAWEANRAEKLAQSESTAAGGFIVRSLYAAAGVKLIRWVASGKDTCPYCRKLDGKVVGIERPFLLAGEDFNPDGAERPLTPRSHVFHPPVHGGCDCGITVGR